jgi:hypothetical protein
LKEALARVLFPVSPLNGNLFILFASGIYNAVNFHSFCPKFLTQATFLSRIRRDQWRQVMFEATVMGKWNMREFFVSSWCGAVWCGLVWCWCGVVEVCGDVVWFAVVVPCRVKISLLVAQVATTHTGTLTFQA